jgi:3-oxoacyl-[acyl-carrier protein] reductase
MGMGSLEGTVSIVTGGARGIGRAYCLGLAREGSAVVVADLGDATPVVEEIEAAGGQAIGVKVDVSRASDTEAMAGAAVQRFGRIDLLVNNAAHFRYVKRGPFTEIPEDEWDKAFAVNVRGTWLCCRAVYPVMQRQGSGRIVNVSSMTVWKGKDGFLHYVASKSAIVGLTRALAREVGPDNIAVNTVVPEYIPHDLEYAQEMPFIDEKVVAERIFKRTQTPEDMVGIVLFLAGPGADFVTGQSILVNGGTWFQ